jgi:hypothetical protein
MKIKDLKSQIRSRLAQSYHIPEDEIFHGMIQEAMVYVASSCEPETLMRYDASEGFGESVLRLEDRGFSVVFPEIPDDEERHLMMDEQLSWAVINYVCFIHSKENGFLMLADRWIQLHNKNSWHVHRGEL